MSTGRQTEVNRIVKHDRAVEVANLLLGKLNGPMRRIFPDDYLAETSRLPCLLIFGTATLRIRKGKTCNPYVFMRAIK